MERLFVPEDSIGYFQITDLSASVGLAAAWAAALPNNGISAGQYVLIIDVEGGNARWRNDGSTTAPTAATGSRLMQDTSMVFTAKQLSNLRFIQETAGAKLNVSVFQQKV